MAKTPNEFRAELVKIMPGYKWTVHKTRFGFEGYLGATGTQSSGSNRLSTLVVEWRESDSLQYEVKSAGYGAKARMVWSNSDRTLARALRGLQEHYERKSANYRSLAADLQRGRGLQGGGAE